VPENVFDQPLSTNQADVKCYWSTHCSFQTVNI